MKTINTLQCNNSVHASDKLRVFDVSNSRTRSITAGEFAAFVEQNIQSQTSIGKQLISVADFGAIGDGITDDTVAVIKAVQYCALHNAQLFWPYMFYLVSSAIPGLSGVEHIGHGVIIRDGNHFYPNPYTGDTNTLYVEMTGVDTNSGLSVNDAFLTIQAAINSIFQTRNATTSQWNIQVGAGMFAGAVIPGSQCLIGSQVNIFGQEGTSPLFEPLTAITGGVSGVSGIGIEVQGACNLFMSNLEFIGYNGDSQSCGWYSAGQVIAVNCWYDSCTFGGYATEGAKCSWTSGMATNCGYNASSVAYPIGAALYAENNAYVYVDQAQYGYPSFSSNACGIYIKGCCVCDVNSTMTQNLIALYANECSSFNIKSNTSISGPGNGIVLENRSTATEFTSANLGSGLFTPLVVSDNSSISLFSATGTNGFTTSRKCIYSSITPLPINTTSPTMIYQNSLSANIFSNRAYPTGLNSGLFKLSFSFCVSTSGFLDQKFIVLNFGTESYSIDFIASVNGNYIISGTLLLGNNPPNSQVMYISSINDLIVPNVFVHNFNQSLDSGIAFSFTGNVAAVGDNITILSSEFYLEGI
jgi:hypothetical protein